MSEVGASYRATMRGCKEEKKMVATAQDGSQRRDKEGKRQGKRKREMIFAGVVRQRWKKKKKEGKKKKNMTVVVLWF
ncbi:uncharacterized protein DS421_8g226500 [Arachis hypogaea]|nr:uncharacterized protein DS421_8g226500 [Arachis hypogaea]